MVTTGWRQGPSTTIWLDLPISHIFPTQSSCLFFLGIRDKSPPPPNTQSHMHTHCAVCCAMNYLPVWWASLQHPLSSRAAQSLALLTYHLNKKMGWSIALPFFEQKLERHCREMGWAYRPSGSRGVSNNFILCFKVLFIFRECWVFEKYIYIIAIYNIYITYIVIYNIYIYYIIYYMYLYYSLLPLRVFPKEPPSTHQIIRSKQMQRPKGGTNRRGKISESHWTEQMIPYIWEAWWVCLQRFFSKMSPYFKSTLSHKTGIDETCSAFLEQAVNWR